MNAWIGGLCNGALGRLVALLLPGQRWSLTHLMTRLTEAGPGPETG
jgi:hypothetical protein